MASIGLGKQSPIVLSQSKANFEALIDRHGQWVRWRTARKCACVISDNSHDIHCPKCGGSGEIYDYQREYEDIFRSVVRDNIIPIPDEYLEGEIIEVYDDRIQKYRFCRCGDFIQICGGMIPNNELVDVRVRVPAVKRVESVVLEKAGAGYYRVPGLFTEPSKRDYVYYQPTGDVIAVDELTDADGKPVRILGYRRDMVLTDSTAETLTAASVEYVMPFRFIVLSQNLSKEDLDIVNACKGEAVCTFPYMYNVSENDVLTVLSGSQTHKILLEKRGDGIDDTIPEFFVTQIDNIETKTATFIEGSDFISVGTNRLHWTGKEPEAGEMMSIAYRYHPTYRVAKEIPMLRTSEDQRIPRKVALTLFSAYAEGKRVNQND